MRVLPAVDNDGGDGGDDDADNDDHGGNDDAHDDDEDDEDDDDDMMLTPMRTTRMLTTIRTTTTMAMTGPIFTKHTGDDGSYTLIDCWQTLNSQQNVFTVAVCSSPQLHLALSTARCKRCCLRIAHFTSE